MGGSGGTGMIAICVIGLIAVPFLSAMLCGAGILASATCAIGGIFMACPLCASCQICGCITGAML